MNQRIVYGSFALSTVFLVAFVAIKPPQKNMIWNRTASAPIGLYRVSSDALNLNDWAVVSANAASSNWIAEHDYLHDDWPVIKRIKGTSGDEICRHGSEISINDQPVATALENDSFGIEMPAWSGCFTLKPGEYFLLNDHERSLDGRYFGATSQSDIDGNAALIWRQ